MKVNFYSNIYIASNTVKSVPKQNFKGIANSNKLRILFGYNLPCMYSGVTMIDPRVATKFLNTNLFEAPAIDVIKRIQPYKQSIVNIEGHVFDIIKENAELYPDKDLKSILKMIAPIHNKRLIKKQTPILKEIVDLAKTLEPQTRYKFKLFMDETNAKIENKPILVPFSSYEFKYKLEKIKQDIEKTGDKKSKKVMSVLLEKSEDLQDKTNSKTINKQKSVLKLLKHIQQKSVLKENEALKELFSVSQNRLNGEKTLIPFYKKTFIYDLSKILDEVPDKNIQERMITLAEMLPNSRNNVSAYIVKAARNSNQKIGYGLMWPYLASVEHILPRSISGPNEMNNFGGACCRDNAERKNLDFLKHLKRCPEARVNCQKYLDRIIELANAGIFAKHHIGMNYINGFRKTIYEQSRGTLRLDISKLNIIKPINNIISILRSKAKEQAKHS